MTKEEAKILMNQVVEDLKPIVQKIEESIPTTRNHYGDYMAVLSRAGNERIMNLLAGYLILAGANEQGVADAILCFK